MKALSRRQQTHKTDWHTHTHKLIILPSDRGRTGNAYLEYSSPPTRPPIPDKALDAPGVTPSIHPTSTDRPTDPTTPSLPSGDTASSLAWHVQRARSHQVKKEGRVKGTSRHLPWKRKSDGRPKPAFQALPSSSICGPAAGGRVPSHKIGAQGNAVKAKDAAFQRREGLCSKASPSPRARGTGMEGRRLPALRASASQPLVPAPLQVGPVLLIWPLRQAPHASSSAPLHAAPEILL